MTVAAGTVWNYKQWRQRNEEIMCEFTWFWKMLIVVVVSHNLHKKMNAFLKYFNFFKDCKQN